MPLLASSYWAATQHRNEIPSARGLSSIPSATPTATSLYIGVSDSTPNPSVAGPIQPAAKSTPDHQRAVSHGNAITDWQFVLHPDMNQHQHQQPNKDVVSDHSSAFAASQQQQQAAAAMRGGTTTAAVPSPPPSGAGSIGAGKLSGGGSARKRPASPIQQQLHPGTAVNAAAGEPSSEKPKRLRITLDEAGNVKRDDILKLYQKAKPARNRRPGGGGGARQNSDAARRGSLISSTPSVGTPASADSDDGYQSGTLVATAGAAATGAPVGAVPVGGYGGMDRRSSSGGGSSSSYLNQQNILALQQQQQLQLQLQLQQQQRYQYPSPRLTQGPPIDSMGDFISLQQGAQRQHINLERMKHDCHTFFASAAMRLEWVPLLLDDRPTFLSSLCVSSIYRDFFIDRVPEQSLRTRLLRTEVIRLINELLQKEATRASDGAIMSVLQLTTCEIMRGAEEEIEVHELGMRKMVNLRSGLERLGMGGLLARVLTGISFISAITREIRPDDMYVRYAEALPVQQVSNQQQRPVPESPIYLPHGDFVALRHTRMCQLPTLSILEDVRDITDAFLKLDELEHGVHVADDNDSGSDTDSHHRRSDGEREQKQQIRQMERQQLLSTIESIYTRTTRNPFPDPTGLDPIYESVRLAAIIYTTALHHRVPFSLAASLAAPTATSSSSFSTPPPPPPPPTISRPSGTRSSSLDKPDPLFFTSSPPSLDESLSLTYNHHAPPPPPPTFATPPVSLTASLKTALAMSDLSNCWGKMSGVLLWICLVGGTAARGKGERNWLVSVAVRGFVVLAFEFGREVVVGLGRLGKVVAALERVGKRER